MSKAKILAELPNLTPEDRGEILMRLWHLDETAAAAQGPSAADQTLLDQELAQFEADGSAGSPWSEVETRLRRPK